MSQAYHPSETPLPVLCVECELGVEQPFLDRDARPLCAACAEAYYVACAGGCGLAPKDDLAEREGELLCAACLAARAETLQIPSDEEAKALVDEFVALHTQQKSLEKRLEAIKERLKLAASARERAGTAVVIRGEGGAVRCAYSKRVNCDSERALALEEELGPERFAELFEKQTTVKPKKEAVLRALEGEETSEALRRALESAVAVVESATLTVKA